MKRFAIVALLVGMVALPLFAQNPTGTLTGHVTDGKTALPGVTVTISSPNMQGTRTAVTTVAGDYILNFLPPGEYKVRFELQGFQTLETTIKLSAAQTSKLDAEMPAATVAEEVTVTGTYETIAASGTAATTFEKSLINKLPIGKDLNSSVLLTAGVNSNGPNAGISIAGSQSYENLFMVNGVVVNENLRGQPLPLYIEDAIQETTTSVSAVSAEYGRFSGGVVNTLTKSGGNEFHASLRDTMNNQMWVGVTPITTAKRADKILNTYEATLGGYVFTDKLWFFGAGRSSKTSAARQFYITDEPYQYNQEQTRYEGKLTWSLTADHRFIGSYFQREVKESNYGFSVSGLKFAGTPSIYDRSQPEELMAFNYTGVLSDNFFVEAQYSQRKFTFLNSGSRYTDIQNGTPLEDFSNYAEGLVYGSPIFCAVCPGAGETRNNQDILVKGSWFLSTAGAGSHDIVLGFDQFEDKRKANNWQSGSSYQLIVDGEVLNDDGTLKVDSTGTPYPVLISGTDNSWFNYTPIFELTTGNNFQTQSIFLNDKWRLNNNWSFNIGLRYDKNHGVNASGAVTSNDSKISPRLGVTFDPKGDGEWLFNASYGEYVMSISNSQGDASAAGGQPASLYYNYYGPDINTPEEIAAGRLLDYKAAIQKAYDWFSSLTQAQQNELLSFASVPGVNAVILKSLISPYAAEASIGFAKRLGTKGMVRMDYVARQYHQFYTNVVDMTTGRVTDDFGNTYDIRDTTNTDTALERKYNGLLVSFAYRFSDAWNLGLAYTWSTLKGNFNGETGGSGPVAGATLTYPEYKAFAQYNPSGYLAADMRQRARMWLVWDAINSKHNRLSVSLMENFYSGYPYGAAGAISIRSYVTNPGYVTPPSSVTYYFQNRDAYRTENITSTDLAITYSFIVPMGSSNLEFFIEPAIRNAFNEMGIQNKNSSVYTSRNAGRGLVAFNPFTGTPKECPQASTAAECSAMGANWKKAPTFGKPNTPADYQTPRTFVLSLGVRF